ncbi:general L-amino acid transport system permease protein [Bradyrhizobium sp. USDA 4538]|uniref:amino acid ABC transporter permease n=1 Tax=unclassified Bradyrhizobium TaxID=2631580 RepID=UPI00209EC748|nr:MULTISPECIES: amino acid ABC transporter permease [unclassified Bradyrhizobium]MCP1845546.1 general L-amino acid transport system permease protein [Bradyrhizobium sp. USDA 4538]MCP1907132.1 general L-amino acid transport system permease protein [Bradyrhizobium sp. USDA 4537]MCP1985608.1 general L-amino acid transport system permease protein [Bradyrhizobium sp. USDA 4539]
MFGTWLNSIITVIVTLGVVRIVTPLLRWLVLDATWHGTSADCLAQDGACWAFITAKFRFIVFAFYPADLDWRPGVACLLIASLLAVTAVPRFWRRELAVGWPAVILLCWLLMSGIPGEARISSNQWGGLPVTLLVWMACFAVSLPLAILLALGRRSRLRALRLLTIGYIEFMRAIPMVAILYFATLILPMALPAGLSTDKLPRAMIMVTLFWTAYTAEVIRGGLQAVPTGQEEAAASLGLSYWRSMRLVILPQALRMVIPGLVNQAIGFLLATSLLAVIGIVDILNAAKAAAADPNWLGFYKEAFLLVAVIYFVIGYGGSRYSLWLEQRLGRVRSP